MIEITLIQRSGNLKKFLYDGDAIEISVKTMADESKRLIYTVTQTGFWLKHEHIAHEIMFRVEEDDTVFKARDEK